MKIDRERCTGCEACYPYCPVQAIGKAEWDGRTVSLISQEECVECGVCFRSGVCPTGAFYLPALAWPRTIRAIFSNPMSSHTSTNVRGRGTNEMKTNDVTGRYTRGFTGVLIEMGRPGIGTTFRELQTVWMCLTRLKVEFEPKNPVTGLIVDRELGKIKEDILDEKVLSAIIEFTIENDRLKEVLQTIKAVSRAIGTVFSLSLISRLDEDEDTPVVAMAQEAGFPVRPNTKVNFGLGRPLKEGA